MVPLWPCGSAACSLKFPPAWTSCPFSTSFTKSFGKWGEKQRGVSVLSSSVKTSLRSACPPPLPSPLVIKSCPLQPPRSWLRWSPRELRANAEPQRLRSSRASRSSDVMTPSSDNWEDLQYKKEYLSWCYSSSFSIKANRTWRITTSLTYVTVWERKVC